MNTLYRDYLFAKNKLVSLHDGNEKNPVKFEALFAIANRYNIRITKGQELADLEVLRYLGSQIPFKVTEAFYRGFPETVKSLTPEILLFDQLLHYIDTYGFNNFEGDAAHSLFEENFTRIAFKESTTIKDFEILSEEEATTLIISYVEDLLCSSRPLSSGALKLVETVLSDASLESRVNIKEIVSRDTATQLIINLNKPELAKFINLSDVLHLVEVILYNKYDDKMTLKKLNLKNKDRKLITKILDNVKINPYQVSLCFEKRADWKGLLHHIHYVPKTKVAKQFIENIRNSATNLSSMSKFESAMSLNKVQEAAKILKEEKGSGAILRNLNYLISRCNSMEEVKAVTDYIESNNPLILLQLIAQYNNYKDEGLARTFTFTKNHKLRIHKETIDETENRKSIISKESKDFLVDALWENLRNIYKNKLGKVYISEEMKKIAVPMQETTAETGYGILPKGTRLHLQEGKIVRAFTYWEKVNDIDLGAVGVTSDGKQMEFSWRTMAQRQGGGIYFSGDQTRGYNGGSEYFDFDLSEIKKAYPTMKYIVLCNNVFSGIPFKDCTCRAGFMLRDKVGSGEVWEPKTVESSYSITGDSTYSYLFALDLEKNDFVWLNMCKNSMSRVAGDTDFTFLARYLNMTDIINIYTLFEMMATELVMTKEDADVIISDDNCPVVEITNDDGTISIKEQEIITSKDTEKILKYLNNK